MFSYLFVAIQDPPTRQVIGRKFDFDPVPRQDFNKVHANFAADLGENLVSTVPDLTRNIALGRVSAMVPSISMGFSFA